MFMYEQICLPTIQCAMYNVYHISIITTLSSGTTFVTYTIALTAINSIKFSSIKVNLIVYNVISLAVSSIINIYRMTQILCSNKLFVIVFLFQLNVQWLYYV